MVRNGVSDARDGMSNERDGMSDGKRTQAQVSIAVRKLMGCELSMVVKDRSVTEG
jgi:hypothetical protein